MFWATILYKYHEYNTESVLKKGRNCFAPVQNGRTEQWLGRMKMYMGRGKGCPRGKGGIALTCARRCCCCLCSRRFHRVGYTAPPPHTTKAENDTVSFFLGHTIKIPLQNKELTKAGNDSLFFKSYGDIRGRNGNIPAVFITGFFTHTINVTTKWNLMKLSYVV